MKNNNITDNEFQFGDKILVSETDLFGTITYANDAFVEVSGYKREELIGQPHNILRHPDMPAAAFADLWRSLKLGLPWSGLVKNRRKNGDYYWVMARATPVYENGKVARYLSVRYTPPRDMVNWAVKSYPLVKQGKVKLKGGQVVSVWDHLSLLNIRSGVLLAVMVAVVLALTLADMMGLFATSLPVLSGVVIGFAALIGFRQQKNVVTLNSYNDALSKLAEGDFNADIQFHHKASLNQLDSYGRLGALIGIAQSNLAKSQNEVEGLATKGRQMTEAMNAASAGIMIVDQNDTIQYVNASLQSILNRHQTTLNQHLNGLDVSHLLGENINQLYQKSTNAEQFSEEVRVETAANIEVGEVVLEFKVKPIFEADTYHGVVIEWQDKSDEQVFRNALSMFVGDLERGVLNRKVDAELVNDEQLRAVAQDLSHIAEFLNDIFNKIAHAMGEIAFSRFSTGLPGRYEGVYRNFQNAINLSMRALNELVGQVQFNSSEVNHAIQELSTGVNNFSDMTQQQAAALQQTSSTMEQMAESVQENSKNIMEVRHLSQGILDQVTEGSEVMNQAIEGMRAIQASGEKIGEITSLIDGLAFQTNLLALNAAVEAARAGDHGRGFAVVAGEVRSLASKSAEAARDIQDLIQASVQEINSGTKLVTETGGKLQEIKVSVGSMSTLVDFVATASKEQETGIQEVNKAIATMDEVAQQEAALIEETAAASMHVADQVKQLDQLVASFELSQEGELVRKRGRTPLAEYKQAHFNWRIRMGNVISGVEEIKDISTVKDHHLCGLGKWRDTDGVKLNQFPEMAQLDETHTAFHQTVAEVIELKNQGREFEAIAKMKDIESLSTELVNLLTDLEKHIERGGVQEKQVEGTHQHLHSPHPESIKKVAVSPAQDDKEWSDF